MIQFNLLPDIKMESVKARRSKRLVSLSATAITGFALIVVIILFLAVNVFQKKHLSDLSKDIKRDSAALQSIPDLNKILTVQNQLRSLPDLHAKKPVVTRLQKYVQQVTPAQVSIADIKVDFEASTINFTGAADSISTINKFVDTLKFTEFTAGESKNKAFSEVVLSSFGRDDKGSSYNINLKFDPLIFSSANEVTLSVPNIISTRSVTEKPTDLFQPLSDTKVNE